MIDHYTFGTEATLEVQAKTAANDAELDNLKMIITENRSARSLAIYNAQAEAAADGSDSDFNYSQTQADISSTANNTGSISDSLEKTDEYLELLTDIAEREAINRFTTAEVKVDFTTNANISSDMDIDGVMNIFEEKLQEAMDSSAEGVYA
ncbi:hypothetical protein SDC9_161422 [bioreactor metagenome]|uniref:Uncharacterized protein n=1 Tax=bioreactor metagenome TaxID=1076179 RepID=A0A645FKA7_9ZZZZ